MTITCHWPGTKKICDSFSFVLVPKKPRHQNSFGTIFPFKRIFDDDSSLKKGLFGNKREISICTLVRLFYPLEYGKHRIYLNYHLLKKAQKIQNIPKTAILTTFQ